MLDDDELQALAEDIRDFGQISPIVIDDRDRILDGKSRLRACEMAGVQPTFETYEGDNPDRYAFSANIRRRNITKGQAAMIAAAACSVSEHRACSKSEHSARSLSEQAGVSLGRIGQAFTVIKFAPTYVGSVISGTAALDEAYEAARKLKAQADSKEAQLARLQAEDPELAARVVEGELTLPGALAERQERIEEEKRQRKVATELLCDVVPALAQTRGTETFRRYDPQLELPGRAVTRQVIEQAMTALSEMADTWRERDLP